MALKYKVIRSAQQYNEYSGILSKLLSARVKTKALREEIELVTLLIDHWENGKGSSQKNSFTDPVAVIRFLMNERNVRAKDLVEILGVNKSMISGILNYKKHLPKEHLTVLAKYFKIKLSVSYTYKTTASPQ